MPTWDLLAEMYQGGSVDSGKVTLGLPGSKVFAKQRIGQAPIHLCQQDEALLPGNGHPGPLPGTPPSGTLEPFTRMRRPKAPHVMAARLALDDGEGAPPSTRMLAPVM